MAETSNTNPHIRTKYSPLRTLAMQALRRFGDFSPSTVDGDVLLMFIEFANIIIDEVRQHPYSPRTTTTTTVNGQKVTTTSANDVNYYTSADEVREIDDQIIVAGLLAQYALQQGSEKIQIYMPNYHRTMNQQLWNALNGNTQIRLRVVDDGTNPSNINGLKTNVYNGTLST
mgnify:FL=1